VTKAIAIQDDSPGSLRPPGSDAHVGLYMRRLFSMRRYAWVAARYELESSASGTVLGRIWLLLGPTLGIFIYWILFDVILGAADGQDNFLAYLTVGLIVFEHSRAGITNAAGALVRQTAILRSLSFPRAVLPLSEAFNSLANAAFSVVVMLVALPLMGVGVIWGWLTIIPLFLVQTAMNYGLGLLLARPMTHFADLRQAMQYIFRLIFYGSGVLFPMEDFVGPTVLNLLTLNPFYCLAQLGRWSMLGTQPQNVGFMFVSVGLWTVVPLVVGMMVFIRGERGYSGVRTVKLDA